MVATVVAPAVAADVMADMAVVGGVVPFLAVSVIPCSRPIRGIPSSQCLFPPSFVPAGATKSVRRRRKMYSNLPGVHHALPEAALPR